MTIIVDASMAAAWLLPDEKTEATDAVLLALHATVGAAPSILQHEVRNILLQSERRKRLSAGKADELLAKFAQIAIEDHGPGDDAEIVTIARVHGLTAYDAAYLALAILTSAPLATLDRVLASACHRARVAVLGPLAV